MESASKDSITVHNTILMDHATNVTKIVNLWMETVLRQSVAMANVNILSPDKRMVTVGLMDVNQCTNWVVNPALKDSAYSLMDHAETEEWLDVRNTIAKENVLSV